MLPTRLVASILLAAAGVVGCSGPLGRQAPASPSEAGSPADAFLSGVRQLTFVGRRSGEGYFSRDGSKLVFQSEREPGNPFYQIYLMDLRSGDVRRVSPGTGKTTCGWIHPSGRRVLFASTHLDPESDALQTAEIASREEGSQRRYNWDYDPHYDLFSVQLSQPDAEPRRLTTAPGYDAEASWSPDGRQIVFSSNRHIYNEDGSLRADLSDAEHDRVESGDLSYFVDLYIMDARGENVRRLTETAGYDGGPFFSPDGKRIVFRRFSEDGATAEIYTMRTDGTDLRQLTSLGVLSWAPFYHPSGDYVIFATNVQGHANFELYVVDAEGASAPVRVTDNDGFDGLPAFSPDGTELVFTRKRPGGTSQLYTAQWHDGFARQALDLPSKTFQAAGPLLPVPTRLDPEIDPRDARKLVEALASDPADGRLTGTPGARIATGWVARVFRSFGLEPAGDDGYYEEFGFTAGVSLGETNALHVSGVGESDGALPNEEWRPLAFSKIGDVEASEVVFAGYGMVAPATPELPAADDYAHLDVEDRWVLVFRYVPEKLSRDARRHFQRYASLRYKAMVARDRGARGILFVSGPNSGVREELVDLRFDASLAGTSIAVLSLTDEVADSLIRAGSEHDLAALQTALDDEIAMPGFLLEGVRLAATIDVQQQRKKGRNVLARLPATRPRPEPLPIILIGAHVDHLGHGAGADSLARGAERSAMHRGADDNASGVAALLEIASWLAAQRESGELQTVRDIVFAAWSGEELGLLGSSAYASKRATKSVDESHPETLDGVAAYINMDMVGRLEEEVALFGIDSSPAWQREVERHNAAIGLPIQPLDDSYLPTDATSFYLKGVPILSAFTGTHEEYHTPRDVPQLLNYPGLADIARLLSSIAVSLASSEDAPGYVATAAPQHGLPRAGLRVYLGTIPDYTNSDPTPGLKLAGVATGGPAEQAGLRGGDLITSVGGQTIENIYDYTYALDSLRVGEPVEIVVKRGDEARTLVLTPASRD